MAKRPRDEVWWQKLGFAVTERLVILEVGKETEEVINGLREVRRDLVTR